jgi:nitrogen fixation negative regulator NifL
VKLPTKQHLEQFAFFPLALLCALGIGLFLHLNQQQRQQSHYAEQQAIFATAYNAAIHSYRLAMESFFDTTLNTPQTLALYQQGLDAQGNERNLLRGRLYRHLFGAYESMKRQNLLQLHFHLADGTSYLRFHQPDLHDDPLFATRPSVRLCNTEKRVIQGMELGKIRSGFRYVFPLSLEDRHLGSVEVSVTFKSILDALNNLAPGKEYGLVLNKAMLQEILFPEQRWLYSPSTLNDHFVVEDAQATLPGSPPPLSATAQALNLLLHDKPTVATAMASGERLSLSETLEGQPYTLTLLPLLDVSRRPAGYLISYAPDPLITELQREFLILLSSSLAALVLIFTLIWRLRLRTIALEEERRNLMALNNALSEGVYVQDSNGIIRRINPAACQLLGYAESELLGQNAHNLFHRCEDGSLCPSEQCRFLRTTEHGQGYDGEDFFLTKSGTLLLMEVAGRPILQDNSVIGAVIAFHDITERKRTEAALRQSEAIGRRLSTAVEQSPASVVITDALGSIEYVNQKFVQKTGYSMEEVIGENPRVLKSGLMPDAVYQNLWETITAGFEWKGELHNRRKDGRLYWESVSISPIRNETGSITHFIAIKEDISERMRMEAQLRENELIQRTLIESLPIGLAIIDSETRIIEEVNPFAAALIGTERDTIIGHPCHTFLCPAERDSCPILDLGLPVDNSDRTIFRADGSKIPVLKTVRPITIKGRIKLLECFVDIRERKRAEGEVRKANHQLEEAIVRAQQLTMEAETANRAKSQFLANMSHEIRTPMNAILGMTHLASQTPDAEKRQRFLQTVQHAAESLLGLLNDILDFSKMEAGQLQLCLAPFSPATLLEGTLATLQMPAEEKGLQLQPVLDPRLPDRLIGDDLRLRQILINLVGNAIKFTAKGTVGLQLSIEEQLSAEEIELHCTVSDTGIGIPADKLTHIFNSFEQVDNSYARQFGGTGLGLSICRQLVHLMDGRIWVESRMGSGSRFHVVVPLRIASGEALEVETQLPSSLPQRHNLRILVVDDNEVNRDVAVMLLEEDNSVTTASNGVEALQVLASANFDIVFMDVQMPFMDGLSATRIIRHLEQGLPLEEELPPSLGVPLAQRLAGRHQTIVAMTAHALAGDREMCLQAGMDTYITKPFQPGQLLEVLQAVQLPPCPADVEESAMVLSPQPDATPSQPTPQQVVEYLQQATGLNAAQIERILAAVQTSLSDNLTKAENAADSDDLPTLAKACHTLKGTLLQCGLGDWAEVAQTLYDQAKQGQDLPYRQQLLAIRHGLEQLI